MRTGILWVIIALLAIVWLISFVVVHITGPLIHILLVVAVILTIWNLVTGRGTSV
jgi:hypothetical protein